MWAAIVRAVLIGGLVAPLLAETLSPIFAHIVGYAKIMPAWGEWPMIEGIAVGLSEPNLLLSASVGIIVWFLGEAAVEANLTR
jgi:hypothetical protein